MKLEHINVKEAVRYMGMGNNKPDERTALLIDECEKELLKVIEPKFVYRVFDVAHKENGVEVIGTPLFLGGNDICRHLAIRHGVLSLSVMMHATSLHPVLLST